MKIIKSLWLWLVLVILLSDVVISESDDTNESDGTEDQEETELLEEESDEDSTRTKSAAAETPVFLERPVYKPPVAVGNVHFTEAFESQAGYDDRWVKSKAVNTETGNPKYNGAWSIEEAKENSLDGDLGLVLKDKTQHSAISAMLSTVFTFTGKPFIVQYEVKFQNGQECGGAYVKLLSQGTDLNLKQFDDKTRYTIMFGPDKCGKDAKVHFIFQHKSPVTGKYEEKHARKASVKVDDIFTDKKTHLFTLVVKPDNLYEIYLDQSLLTSGSLLKDMTPPVNPAKEIADPAAKKPQDWDDREKIADPEAKKPDDWDESQPEMIPDSTAVMPDGWLENVPEHIPNAESEKPSDWNDEEDGDWEAPLISNPACSSAPGCGPWKAPLVKNPKYKGTWSAPLISNPDYDGKWAPAMIPNPEYFDDTEPYKMTPIAAIGLELWSISDGVFFDNFIVTDDKAVADRWADDSWKIKRRQELSVLGRSAMDVFSDLYHDQPWLFVVLILCIVLPIAFFFVWCCRASETKDWFTYLWDLGKEHPWIWAVYIVALLLPFVLLSVFFCPKSGPLFKASDIEHRKKTDDITKDMPPLEGEEDFEEDLEEEVVAREPKDVSGKNKSKSKVSTDGSGAAPKMTRASKAESKIKSSTESAEENNDAEADNEDDDEENDDESEPIVDADTKRSSPRKRTTQLKRE